jgi:hypothetical protein
MAIADDFARFMTMVRVGSAACHCWEWTGNRPDDRYGHFTVGAKAVKAHRWIYQTLHGPIPDGDVVRHKCDNPACVNPMHLELGTLSDNTRDAVARGRWPNRQGEKHPLAQVTAEHVKAIRSAAACGVTHKTLSYQFGVSRQQIGKIVRRENWSHI